MNTDIFEKSIGLNNSVNKNDMQLQHEWLQGPLIWTAIGCMSTKDQQTYIDGLAQDCSNSIANVLQLRHRYIHAK